VRYSGDMAEVMQFAGRYVTWNNGNAWVQTPRGLVQLNIGDYLIKAADNDFYPCTAEVFNKRWESDE
jgi:hypothetical protein